MAAAGKPPNYSPVRDQLAAALDRAESYARSAPAQLVGLLAIDDRGGPVMIADLKQTGVSYRRATIEPEVMPEIPTNLGWRP